MGRRYVGWLAAGLMALPAVAAAQVPDPKLAALSLDELLKLEVTTVTRLPETRLQSPASVYVLTQDDIRRSGATTLAEVLRLVPGVHVAQIDGNKWAIGIRGFTDRLARAMLVLIDGRAVYSPLFAGTYWEAQDVPLDDIDRIEIVRGPGGALWGANAVTGIVNVIRKRASLTQGTSVTVESGTEDPALVGARFGGSRGSQFQYRISGQAGLRSPQVSSLGLNYDDASRQQAGFRLDWDTTRGAVTLQGDVYHAVIGERDTITSYSPPVSQNLITQDPLSGGNVLLRWTPRSADPHAPQLQVYYDRTARHELVFKERQHTVDVDFQQGKAVTRHDLLWGASYRVVAGSTETKGTLRFDPPDRTDQLVTGFIQDEIQLVPEKVSLIAGVKTEHNVYSGMEWQPSARLVWTMSPARAVSISASRAVRTPSRVERDFESGSLLSPAGPTFVRLVPNPDFAPEELIAYQAGLVTMVGPQLLATVAVFHNEHDNVVSTELGATFTEADASGSRTIVPVSFGNGLKGHSDGIEVTADARIASWWRLTGSYSYLAFQLFKKPGSADVTQEARGEGGSPQHQAQMGSTFSVSNRVSVDWFLRYVSALPALNVKAYTTSNVRIEWRVNDRLSVFAVGRNLHDAQHPEFTDGSNGAFGIERSALVGLRWTR